MSVGALNKSQLTMTFQPNGPTTILYSLTDPKPPGFTFSAMVIHHISFLNLDFVLQSEIVPQPHAFVTITFSETKHSSTLWHHCFRHLGMDATQAALTKEYITSVHLDGPFIYEHCVACIVGKSPQHFDSHHGNRASQAGELIHMDPCGPYLVQTPDEEHHFYLLLDDKSNFGFTHLLQLKSNALLCYQGCFTSVFWEVGYYHLC